LKLTIYNTTIHVLLYYKKENVGFVGHLEFQTKKVLEDWDIMWIQRDVYTYSLNQMKIGLCTDNAFLADILKLSAIFEFFFKRIKL
jgi:hypothetical protein